MRSSCSGSARSSIRALLLIKLSSVSVRQLYGTPEPGGKRLDRTRSQPSGCLAAPKPQRVTKTLSPRGRPVLDWGVERQVSFLCESSTASGPASTGLDAWDVDRLIRLSAEFPVRKVPLETIQDLDTVYWFDGNMELATVRKVVEHFRLVQEADPSYPIILGRDGRVMDGMHRVAACLASRAPYDRSRTVRGRPATGPPELPSS